MLAKTLAEVTMVLYKATTIHEIPLNDDVNFEFLTENVSSTSYIRNLHYKNSNTSTVF